MRNVVLRLGGAIPFHRRAVTRSRTSTNEIKLVVRDDALGSVSIVIELETGSATVFSCDLRLEDDMVQRLLEVNGKDIAQVDDRLRTWIDDMKQKMLAPLRRVVGILGYLALNYFLDEEGTDSTSFDFSVEGQAFMAFPSSRQFTLGMRPPCLLIDEATKACIQATLDSQVIPLDGLRLIARAKNEDRFSSSWIDATTGAELAIKEALVRKEPTLRVLLEELPSPALTKLYGPVAKEYFGQRSPYLSELQVAMELRNKLMHRPNYVPPKRPSLAKHLAAMERAVLHLMTLLYPNDRLVARAYAIDRRELITTVRPTWS